VVLLLLLGVSAFLGSAYWMLFFPPAHQQLRLHPALVSLESEAGLALLAHSVHSDHDALMPLFASQERPAWCGVASSAMVLSALRDPDTSQAGVFTPAASQVRSSLTTTVAGMTLDQLAGLLDAHGLQADPVHAGESSAEAFRAALRQNMADADDFVLVNYHRPVVEQKGGGHISPVGAYDAESDRVLVLDVSAYKYPPVWVGCPLLFASMNTVDPSSGLTRGWVAARERP
jgi:hypothetical protein